MKHVRYLFTDIFFFLRSCLYSLMLLYGDEFGTQRCLHLVKIFFSFAIFFSFITLGTRNMRLFLYTQLANWAKRISRKIPSFWLTYDTTFGSVRMELGSGARTVSQTSTNFNGCHSTKMSYFDFLDSLQTPHLSSQDSADANIFPRVEFYYKFEILLIKCHATPYRASCSSFQNSICQLVYIVYIIWPHSIMGL